MPFSKNKLISFAPSDDGFKAGGKEFLIYDEKMGFEKIKAFQAISQRIISNKGADDQIEFLKTIYKTLRSDKTPLAAISDSVSMLYNHLKSIEESYKLLSPDQLRNHYASLSKQRIEDYLDLCCCFIYTKDEDMTKHDMAHQNMKKEIWRNHCDGFSFFLSGMLRLPQLAQRLKQNSPIQDEKENQKSHPAPTNL